MVRAVVGHGVSKRCAPGDLDIQSQELQRGELGARPSFGISTSSWQVSGALTRGKRLWFNSSAASVLSSLRRPHRRHRPTLPNQPVADRLSHTLPLGRCSRHQVLLHSSLRQFRSPRGQRRHFRVRHLEAPWKRIGCDVAGAGDQVHVVQCPAARWWAARWLPRVAAQRGTTTDELHRRLALARIRAHAAALCIDATLWAVGAHRHGTKHAPIRILLISTCRKELRPAVPAIQQQRP